MEAAMIEMRYYCNDCGEPYLTVNDSSNTCPHCRFEMGLKPVDGDRMMPGDDRATV
jgi:DNA-directed RNA polymerase subunit RPC12/RpoP